MSDDKSIQLYQDAFMPVMAMESARQRRGAIVSFVKEIMVKDTDYGVIPGTGDKPTLYKPGAEKLVTFFGLTTKFICNDKTEDWTGVSHDSEPFFYYRFTCELWRGDLLIAQGEGSCNSWEKKYRYRKGERVCPQCGASAIIKSKAEWGGGWLCFMKKGGCGMKWKDGAAEIESQSTGQVKNDNPADIVNTVLKMAQKRALVAAVLVGVNASEFFTQDVEDMSDFGYGDVIDGSFTEQKPQQKPQQPSKQKQSQQATKKVFWPGNIVQAIVADNPGANPKDIIDVLNLSKKIDVGSEPSRASAWYGAVMHLVSGGMDLPGAAVIADEDIGCDEITTE